MHTMIARAAYNSPADGSVPPARALDPARSALTSSEGITLASPLPMPLAFFASVSPPCSSTVDTTSARRVFTATCRSVSPRRF